MENKGKLILLGIGLVLACLTTDHEVARSISGTYTNFKFGLGLERGPPSLVSRLQLGSYLIEK